MIHVVNTALFLDGSSRRIACRVGAHDEFEIGVLCNFVEDQTRNLSLTGVETDESLCLRALRRVGARF